MKILPGMLLICFLGFISELNAQRLIERGMILNPLENPAINLEEEKPKWFTQVGGWASFGNYGFYGDGNHQWYQHLGAYVEIYRRENISSLAVTSQIEFIADPENDINFSPRAIFWEEGLLYSRKIRGSFLQIGYYHRCKHDIDNLRFGEERTMVFGSALARYVIPFRPGGGIDAIVALQYDHYTITWEKRTPAEFEGDSYDWSRLNQSVKLNSSIQKKVGRKTNLHLDGYTMATFFKNDFLMNAKIRTEIGSSTPIGDVRFGVHLEHLGDSGIPVQPKSVTLLGVGIRIMTPGSIR